MSRRITVCLALYLMEVAGARARAESIQDKYSAVSRQLIQGALEDRHSLDRLEYLCDNIGNRLSGSPALERAVKWAEAEMRSAGLENVRVQPVKVPHWVRGKESAVLVAPLDRPLRMLGIGNSVGTPSDGITADVVAVSNFDEMEALGPEKVKGKIVLFDAPYQGYGRTVTYRVAGASRAAKLGAVAVVIRSVGSASLATPHTGTLVYDVTTPKIPAAALSSEDAQSIHRLCMRGTPVRMRLTMQAHMEPNADSANVYGEIPGSEKPQEIVAVGGHIDSWDVGQGAQDDGSGIMASLEAVALIKRLGLKPRRTIRVVFWVNEENGSAGGEAYRAMLGDDVKNHVAAIEMDGGAERPIGFGIGGSASPVRASKAPPIGEGAYHRAVEIGHLLESIGASEVTRSGGGSDIEPLMAAGVPGIGELSAGTHYFDWHHTDADTFDKINPEDFRTSVASMAVMVYVLADMPERLSDLN